LSFGSAATVWIDCAAPSSLPACLTGKQQQAGTESGRRAMAAALLSPPSSLPMRWSWGASGEGARVLPQPPRSRTGSCVLASCVRGTRGLEMERRSLVLSGLVSSVVLVLPMPGREVMGCLSFCCYRVDFSSLIFKVCFSALVWWKVWPCLASSNFPTPK
jgi:hypothetical protein